ncbi:MAG: ATP synthase F0 subunit B [Oligoflexia bacterium]
MAAIINQLGLDSTFFAQIGVFFVLFFFLSRVYFKPFLKLFEERHARTVADREAAQALMAQADEKLSEYQQKLSDARARARKEIEDALRLAHQEEQQILAKARDEAKQLTQSALQEIERERLRLKGALETDAEGLAKSIVDHLLVKKGT